MPSSVVQQPASRHPVLPDIGKKRMARIPDIEWNARIGGAIQRAVAIVGWSNKEAAARIGVDDAEFGKWLSGARRPQLDKLFAVEALRWPLIQALAGLDTKNEVITTIRRLA